MLKTVATVNLNLVPRVSHLSVPGTLGTRLGKSRDKTLVVSDHSELLRNTLSCRFLQRVFDEEKTLNG